MSVTVGRLLAEAETTLREAEADTPGLDARLLAQEVLRLQAVDLQTTWDEAVPEPLAQELGRLVARRAQHEPLQYILGYTEFYGLRFFCDRRAMIPRPETETLVEVARTVCAGLRPPELVVDVGTGAGVVGITLAVHNPSLRVEATDISAPALQLARTNVRYHHVAPRVTLAQGKGLEPVVNAGEAAHIAVVVSNPPYVRSDEYARLQPEISHWEPRVALDGGPEGLDAYTTLLAQCAALPYLRTLCLEVGYDQADRVGEMVQATLDQATIEFVPDLSGVPRVVVAKVPQPAPAAVGVRVYPQGGI